MLISRISYSSIAIAMMLTLGACSQSNQETTNDNNANTDTSASTEKTLRFATEGAYAPFNYTNADGSLSGFDIDVANAICKQMKVKCDIVAQEWGGIINGLTANKYDAIIAGMSVTPEREKKVDFTTPYFSNTMVWLAPSNKKFNPNNIVDKTLGGQRSTTPGAYLQEHYDGKNGNKVNIYDTYDNAYLDLKSGRTDAVLAEKVSAKNWLKDNQQGFSIIGDEIDNNDNIAIAVRKNNPLKEQINQALQELRDNGELARIEQANFNQ